MTAATLLALAALTGTTAPAPSPSPETLIARWVRGTEADRPRVNLWLNRDDVYNRGDKVRIYFKTDADAYVTVVRIDTDGRVRVLFPIDPWDDAWARGGRTFEVLGRDRDEAFRVDDYPGVGYIFAIASQDPFVFDDVVRGDHWDYRNIADGRIRGDPYVAASDFAERVAREGDYDYDVTEYYVEKHYDYPRFVCYDCHTYASWRYWDPYHSYCSRFRIVIYDDWYYYPYRRYRGGVVVVRPYRPGPRYVFKDTDPRNDYVTRVAERPRGRPDYQRPAVDRDRTSADIGGRGAVPVPVSPRRRTDPSSSGQAGGVPVEGRRPVERDRTSASPSARPDEGGRTSSTPDTRSPTDDPRRRAPAPRSGEPAGTRDVTPQSSGDPDRGSSDDRGRRPSTPEPSRDTPRNREPSRDTPAPREPSRDAPTQREPSRDTPTTREPSRPSSPAPAERPRAEPKSEPRSAPTPRSSGEPQLKRRRP